MPATRNPPRAGWGAIAGASVVGLAVSLAILGLAQLWTVTVESGGSVGWLVLLSMPTIGGAVAGVRTHGSTSAAVGSGLLVGLWLGAIAVHVGIGQSTGLFGGDRPAVWLLWGILGTPFLMLASGVGGLVGAGLAAVFAGWQGRSSTVGATGRSSDSEAPDGGRILVGIGRATLEGVVATVAFGVVGVFGGPVILGAPFLGGFVAGYRSPGLTGLGTFCGLATGVVAAIGAFTLVVLELRSQTYVAPGVGIALVLLAGVSFVGVVFATVGGFVGAMVATAEESRAEGAERPADSVEF